MTYAPSITGNFTFFVHVYSETGVTATREIQIASEFYMDILFVYPYCFAHYGHCMSQSLELFANKAYDFDNQCFFTESSSLSKSTLDAKDIAGDLMLMQACSPLCSPGQQFNSVVADMLQVSLDLSELPHELSYDSFINLAEEMPLSHIKIY
jgi:hypothetical protein